MPLLCVTPPQKPIFFCADFGSTFALDVHQKVMPFLHSSQENGICDLFLELIALS